MEPDDLTPDNLKQRLPQAIAARVQSLRHAGGVVTAILDAGGLGASARVELEHTVKQTLG